MPFIISLIPADYFMKENKGLLKKLPLALYIIMMIIKNLAGLLFTLAGLIMLITPGQGLLTILAGLAFMNFPGKRNIEIRLIKIKKVTKSLDWIRKKMNKCPIEIPGKAKK